MISIGGLLLDGMHSDGSIWKVRRDEFDGWDGSDSSMEVTQRPAGDGGWGSEPHLRARILVIGGTVRTPTAALLWQIRAQLTAAVSLADTPLVVTEPDGTVWTMTVRRQGRPLVRLASPKVAEWSISLTALRPRKLGAPVTLSTALPSSAGGRTYPYTYPYTYASTMVSGIVTIENPGTIAGPVPVRFAGPVQAPAITQVGPSGVERRYATSLALASGSWLDVDCDEHTSLENGQSPRDGYITSREWPVLEPGVNQFAFAAGAYSSTARAIVTAWPARE